MCRQEEAETEEATAEAAEAAAAAGEERSWQMLTIGDCELRSLLMNIYSECIHCLCNPGSCKLHEGQDRFIQPLPSLTLSGSIQGRNKLFLVSAPKEETFLMLH